MHLSLAGCANQLGGVIAGLSSTLPEENEECLPTVRPHAILVKKTTKTVLKCYLLPSDLVRKGWAQIGVKPSFPKTNWFHENIYLERKQKQNKTKLNIVSHKAIILLS